MSVYLTSEMSRGALGKMQRFYQGLHGFYAQNGLDIANDIGRRNILMSSLQEKYLAEELAKVYPKTKPNGKTGEPDIIVPELNCELECKLTSKNRSGSWALQTDYGTLKKKGAVDHVYILASDDFDTFAVLFFKGLTIEDFHSPSTGSKGKARINYRNAMAKCTPLVGNVNYNAMVHLNKAIEKMNDSTVTPAKFWAARDRLAYWATHTRISFELEGI